MRRITSLAAAAVVLLLAGCAGGAEQTDQEPIVVERNEPERSDDATAQNGDATTPLDDSGTAAGNEGTASPDAGGTASPDGAAVGQQGDPLTSGCEPLTADGDVYTVADAGAVELRDDGGRLRLVDVRPAEGWTHRTDDESSDEVEITFRHDDGRRYEFEADFDANRLEVDVCVDD